MMGVCLSKCYWGRREYFFIPPSRLDKQINYLLQATCATGAGSASMTAVAFALSLAGLNLNAQTGLS